MCAEEAANVHERRAREAGHQVRTKVHRRRARVDAIRARQEVAAVSQRPLEDEWAPAASASEVASDDTAHNVDAGAAWQASHADEARLHPAVVTRVAAPVSPS